MNQYISRNARIVHAPHFESALVKISNRAESSMTDEELAAVENLKLRRVDNVVDLDDENEAISFLDAALLNLVGYGVLSIDF